MRAGEGGRGEGERDGKLPVRAGWLGLHERRPRRFHRRSCRINGLAESGWVMEARFLAREPEVARDMGHGLIEGGVAGLVPHQPWKYLG
ncbi:MAG: hypothetical protein B7Y53_01520 [Halothiobacillus sp. 28-55-5]|nr:MAG: hypothetical protein B7Y53_01520 [Halothiobacillus sp. 28-55-5]